MDEAIERIKKEVHSKLNFERYNSTVVREYTNCYSHALGSQYIGVEDDTYRIGAISGKKDKDERFISVEELKELFFADLSTLELGVSEILFADKESFLKNIEGMDLSDNQHIVVLFAIIYSNNQISDFHFIRYDRSVGWTDKRYDHYPSFLENIHISWPTGWEKKVVGAYIITR